MGNIVEVEILMAEDDDGHYRLIVDILKKAGISSAIVRFKDGQEAWDFFSGKAAVCFDAKKHYVLILDIRLPKMSGVEVLRRIKENSCLKNLSVIMLTSTDDQLEVDRCYELGCNSYLVKPVQFEEFSEVIKRLGLFISIVKLGTVCPAGQ